VNIKEISTPQSPKSNYVVLIWIKMKLTLRNYSKFDKTTTYDISVSKQSAEEAAAGVGCILEKKLA
jgi:hypothetical protein